MSKERGGGEYILNLVEKLFLTINENDKRTLMRGVYKIIVLLASSLNSLPNKTLPFRLY